MNNTELKTLVPAIVSLIVFGATIFGKTVNQMDVEQIVTALVTLAGVIFGILTNHSKPTVPAPAPVPVVVQPPIVPPAVKPVAAPQPFQGEGI